MIIQGDLFDCLALLLENRVTDPHAKRSAGFARVAHYGAVASS